MTIRSNTYAFSSLANKHNIANVYLDLWAVAAPDFRTQTGILALFGPTGSRPSVTSTVFGLGRGGANWRSIPAARYSARSSIILSIKSINCFRKFATLFNRFRRNSEILPWWTESKYSITRRSRSSAVKGLRMASRRSEAGPGRRLEMSCEVLTSSYFFQRVIARIMSICKCTIFNAHCPCGKTRPCVRLEHWHEGLPGFAEGY